MVRQSWDVRHDVLQNLMKFTETMVNWNRTVYENIFERKRAKLKELTRVQKNLEINFNSCLNTREATIHLELEHILSQDELLWLQKARSKWLADGD